MIAAIIIIAALWTGVLIGAALAYPQPNWMTAREYWVELALIFPRVTFMAVAWSIWVVFAMATWPFVRDREGFGR